MDLTEFEAGFLLGLLVGEGHFGGDGRQAQVTLRMHSRHRAIFDWLVSRVPVGRLYGPYDHGGRRYYQWMVRGPALKERFVPFLDKYLTCDVDGHVFERYTNMKKRYRL